MLLLYQIITVATISNLPDFFPLVDKKKSCLSVQQKLFTCIDANCQQVPGERDAHAGDKALTICAKDILAYETCLKKVGLDKSLKLVRAPQSYLEELEIDEKRQL